MKIHELIRKVAELVESREIIEHGSIRMLHDEQAIRQIKSADGCDEVGSGTIGDDDLSAGLMAIARDGDQIGDLYFADLVRLESAYLGDDLSDYVDAEKEDELRRLDDLIDAAREIA